MDLLSTVLLCVGVAVAIYVLLKIMAAPVKLAVKLLLNAVTGFLLLLLANFISGFFDFSIPINFLTCVISGAFGIPGVILVVVLVYFGL